MVPEQVLDLTDRRSLMASLPPGGVGAEIGVAEGAFSQTLLEVCRPSKLYLIDSWQHIASWPLVVDASNVVQDVQEEKYAQVLLLAARHPEVHVMRARSLSAVKQFADEAFDIIDARLERIFEHYHVPAFRLEELIDTFEYKYPVAACDGVCGGNNLIKTATWASHLPLVFWVFGVKIIVVPEAALPAAKGIVVAP